jgi:hypothetical protein
MGIADEEDWGVRLVIGMLGVSDETSETTVGMEVERDSLAFSLLFISAMFPSWLTLRTTWNQNKKIVSSFD